MGSEYGKSIAVCGGAEKRKLIGTAKLHGPPSTSRLTAATYEQLGEAAAYDVDARLSRENHKGRVLAALARRALANADIREITQLDRQGAKRLIQELRDEGRVVQQGRGRASRWVLASRTPP
jgi:predicted HTH transcriptional regulator